MFNASKADRDIGLIVEEKRMKKAIILVLIGVISLNLSACKKDVSQDVYANAAIVEENTNGEDHAATEIMKIDEVTQEVIEEEVEVSVNYPVASDPIDYGVEALKAIEGERVEDEDIHASIEALIRKIYYNYYFTPSIDMESGLIDASNMALFSIAYIMQHDNEGLPFDYASYQLSIPNEKVAEIVAEYFKRDLDIHGSYEDFKIEYNEEKECYKVIVEDDQWDVDLVMNEIRQLNDTTYRVICDLPRKISGVIEQQIEAMITYEEETPIMIYYMIRDKEETTEEEMTEE
jgi:hypothetical protein